MSGTFVGMPAFPIAARAALGDTQLRANLAHATRTIRDKRAAVVAEAEAAGFDGVTCSDHYWLRSVFPHLWVSLAAMSGATQDDAGLASGLINTTAQVGGALEERDRDEPDHVHPEDDEDEPGDRGVDRTHLAARLDARAIGQPCVEDRHVRAQRWYAARRLQRAQRALAPRVGRDQFSACRRAPGRDAGG